MAADPIQVTLTEHDRRLAGHHRRLGEIQVKQADDERTIAVLESEVADTRGDVTKIEQAIKDSDTKREAEGAANRKALYTVAAFMATFSVSIMGLIVALVGHA